MLTLSIQRPRERPPDPSEFRVSAEAAVLLVAIVLITVAGVAVTVWRHRRESARRRGEGR